MKRLSWDHNVELNILQVFHNGCFFRPFQIYIGTGEYAKIGLEILGIEGSWYWGGGFIFYWERGSRWHFDLLWLREPVLRWLFGER